MNALLYWLLRRMAANPATVVWERDLAERFPDSFLEAQQAGLVRRTPAAVEGDRYDRLTGPGLTIMSEGDGLVGTDEDDPDHVPVPLIELDLQRCRLDLDAFVSWFKVKNGIDGPAQRAHDRFYQIGETDRGRVAVVLGLFLPITHNVSIVMSIPAFLSKGFKGIVVLSACGLFDTMESQALRGRDILVVPLDQELTVNLKKLDMKKPRAKPNSEPRRRGRTPGMTVIQLEPEEFIALYVDMREEYVTEYDKPPTKAEFKDRLPASPSVSSLDRYLKTHHLGWPPA